MELKEFKSVPVGELQAFQDQSVIYAETPGQQAGTSYQTTIMFYLDPRFSGQTLSISTPQRRVFLEHSTEKKAERALVRLTRATHAITGGLVYINPSYGGVYGTKTRPLQAPRDPADERPYESLSTWITVARNGGIFSETLSDEYRTIPQKPVDDGEALDKYRAYMELALKINPNQYSRDEAGKNGVSGRWEAEFWRFNPRKILEREPMVMTIGSVATILGSLKERGIYKAPVFNVVVEA